ncbi:hypothetical protein CQ057_22500 [Ochrobactrum sp. MYb49]|nr:hypothetical protein CQ057_22500 [Ochrobactrum sp. MYb49]
MNRDYLKTVPIAQQEVLLQTLSVQLEQKRTIIARFLAALSLEGFCVTQTEELSAILADLNRLISEYVPAEEARVSLAYLRSLELSRLLDEQISHS